MTSSVAFELISKTDIYQFKNDQFGQKETGVRYIAMAINGLESIHKNTKIRKFGGLSREAYFLEFKAHCNIYLPVNRC